MLISISSEPQSMVSGWPSSCSQQSSAFWDWLFVAIEDTTNITEKDNVTQGTTPRLHAVGDEHSATTLDPNPKGDTADQRWLEASDRKFWRFLVPTLILMLATVTATAFCIAHQNWITIATTPDLNGH